MNKITIVKAADCTTITFPFEFYKGFKLEAMNGQVLVYDVSGERPQIVWSEYDEWDGENGWDKCKQWIDQKEVI
jgi:hypothetical protein